ncbi:hypothetical protein UFOVP1504_9 [uncultured Caudovirales phage]|uniref:Uncharacterized protein n=1 Tax=uncultured Caudovirales phage TaxID=2100421 RepID=A0A6J5SP81_9CAUD|nr:hypothetical protein UFOVP1143_15 [uncultured Caudovirales phage]CAB4217010.1 hypothetical protein UFOVP1504_9 [uncultured Caudovirales phage]
MLGEPPGSGQFAWRCIECEAAGYGGSSAFTTHYLRNHSEPTPTYLSYLREARNEHGLRGAAAYQWAHAAWAEYEKNQ